MAKKKEETDQEVETAVSTIAPTIIFEVKIGETSVLDKAKLQRLCEAIKRTIEYQISVEVESGLTVAVKYEHDAV